MRTLMRTLMLLSLTAVVGCASANNPAPEPADVGQTVRVATPGGGIMVNTVSSTASNVATVAVPLNVAWAMMPWVFDSLGIKVSIADQPSYTIGNRTLKLRRQLGDVPLSRYINCGNAQGPPSADTYEIQASILTQLRSDGQGGTTITTTLETAGRPVMLSGEYANCSSRGVLEQKIVALIKARA